MNDIYSLVRTRSLTITLCSVVVGFSTAALGLAPFIFMTA